PRHTPDRRISSAGRNNERRATGRSGQEVRLQKAGETPAPQERMPARSWGACILHAFFGTQAHSRPQDKFRGQKQRTTRDRRKRRTGPRPEGGRGGRRPREDARRRRGG